jgi:hypothetical protein
MPVHLGGSMCRQYRNFWHASLLPHDLVSHSLKPLADFECVLSNYTSYTDLHALLYS